MASSDRTPQYRKEENLILMVCLQEQMLVQTMCRRNIVEQYMIKMEDITIYTTKKTFITMIEEKFR
jgi:hypothetical protein